MSTTKYNYATEQFDVGLKPQTSVLFRQHQCPLCNWVWGTSTHSSVINKQSINQLLETGLPGRDKRRGQQQSTQLAARAGYRVRLPRTLMPEEIKP